MFVSSPQMDTELQMIVDYNFELRNLYGFNKFLYSCISPRELAIRLWNYFRWKGYIDPNVKYTSKDSSDWSYVHDDLLRQLKYARTLGLQNPRAMERTNSEFKRQAFQSLGNDTISYVMEKYRMDYLLFGFEKDTEMLIKLLKWF